VKKKQQAVGLGVGLGGAAGGFGLMWQVAGSAGRLGGLEERQERSLKRWGVMRHRVGLEGLWISVGWGGTEGGAQIGRSSLSRRREHPLGGVGWVRDCCALLSTWQTAAVGLYLGQQKKQGEREEERGSTLMVPALGCLVRKRQAAGGRAAKNRVGSIIR
jgi:hypothetical protein